MVFSSTVFLLIFLPVVAGIYFLCPRKARNTVLLLFSLVFYGWGEPKYILIMLFSTVFDYTNARLIGHFQDTGRDKAAKTVLIVDLVGNLGILGFFKYTDFAIDNLNSLLNAGIPRWGWLCPSASASIRSRPCPTPSTCTGASSSPRRTSSTWARM